MARIRTLHIMYFEFNVFRERALRTHSLILVFVVNLLTKRERCRLLFLYTHKVFREILS